MKRFLFVFVIGFLVVAALIGCGEETSLVLPEPVPVEPIPVYIVPDPTIPIPVYIVPDPTIKESDKKSEPETVEEPEECRD